MNVFVLSTGRCGSKTFAEACRHITNYTAGHQTRWSLLGPQRLDYPDRHIESDNRLCWLLGRLDERFGDQAFYVHLIRDRAAVAASLNKRWRKGGIIPAYARVILYRSQSDLEACEDYWDTVNSNIRLFLKDKPHKMTFRLEEAQTDFRRFWALIGATGNLEATLREWNVRHNASE